MTGLVIRELDPAPFAALYGLSTKRWRSAVRMPVDARQGFPCCVSLEDADMGESVLLLNRHLPVASPYRQRHAIFVREGAVEAAQFANEVPGNLPHAFAAGL